MIWQSWSDFFAMGGYAFYVWGSVLVVAGCMLVELAGLRMRRKAIVNQLKFDQRPGKRGGKGRVVNETAA